MADPLRTDGLRVLELEDELARERAKNRRLETILEGLRTLLDVAADPPATLVEPVGVG